jgi:bifunctional non-homologous end joining protein LigD
VLIKDGNRIEVRSRTNKDLKQAYPDVAEAALRVKAAQVVIDGEIVAIDAQGRPSFRALQHRGSHANHRIVFYAFDLLHLDGVNLTDEQLDARRAPLPQVLDGSGLLVSRELPGTPSWCVAEAKAGVFAGVRRWRISSWVERHRCPASRLLRRDRPAVRRQGASGLRAASTSRGLQGAEPHHVDDCPFVDLPNSKSSRWSGGITADEMREMQWVKPTVVVQVRFVEWTAEGRLRHAAFVGLRHDKDASEVHRE